MWLWGMAFVGRCLTLVIEGLIFNPVVPLVGWKGYIRIPLRADASQFIRVTPERRRRLSYSISNNVVAFFMSVLMSDRTLKLILKE